jgi:hypothetical protein
MADRIGTHREGRFCGGSCRSKWLRAQPELSVTMGNHKHGHYKNRKASPEYSSWRDMIQRCTNKNRKKYRIYGGRGITVCQEWLDSSEAFLAHIGPKPTPAHTLGRKNNNGNYEPGNIQWETQAEQSKNRRTNVYFTIDGETKIMLDWCRLYKVYHGIVHQRLKAGWPVEEAFKTPANGYSENNKKTTLVTINGETKSIVGWCKHYKIKPTTVHSRKAKGMSIEDAITTPTQSKGSRFKEVN